PRHRRAYPSCAGAYLRGGTGARPDGFGAAGDQRLGAIGADELGRSGAPALVREAGGRGAGPLDVAVAPLSERHDHRVELHAGLREVVLEARRVLLVAAPLED